MGTITLKLKNLFRKYVDGDAQGCVFRKKTFYPRLRPGVEQLTSKKDHSAGRKFWKVPIRDTEKLYCGSGLNIFLPLQVPILEQH